jgi:hypothetical protein
MNARANLGLISLAILAAILVSCAPSAKSGRGLILPEGDADRGLAAFINLNCTECHTVRDVATPPPPERSEVFLELGGEVFRVKTYGQLVTSITNPDHIISSKYLGPLEESGSPMPDLTNEMTVAELIDLVTFLNAHYSKRPAPDYSAYQLYP